jgi:hypothetical protein
MKLSTRNIVSPGRNIVWWYRRSPARSLSTDRHKVSHRNIETAAPFGTVANADNHPPSNEFDIIVNGGSIVGATFVADLVQTFKNTLKICIIDQRSPPNYEECIQKSTPDLRVYALSPSSISYLKGLNIWHLIESRSQPYDTMKIWETLGPGKVT